jgi:hypothetical protein
MFGDSSDDFFNTMNAESDLSDSAETLSEYWEHGGGYTGSYRSERDKHFSERERQTLRIVGYAEKKAADKEAAAR